MRCCTLWRTRAGELFWRSCAITRRARESWPRRSRSPVRARPGICAGGMRFHSPAYLRVLREAGLVGVRLEAQHRIYSLRPEALIEVDEWLAEYRVLWQSRLDALHTEIARGKKART